MATTWHNAYQISIVDESGSTSDDVLRSVNNIVVEVRDTSDALSTLFTTRQGTTTLQNPFVMSQADDGNNKLARFYSTDATVNIAIFDYGNGTQTTDHGQYFGRYGRLLNVGADTGRRYIKLSSQDATRIVRVPLLATGTDANDTPASWDNALANCVIANGSAVEIIFPPGFMIEDVVYELETTDASATYELGFDNATESGDVNGLVETGVLDGTDPYQPWTVGTKGDLLQVASSGADGATHYVTDGTIKTLVVKGSSGINTARGNVFILGKMLPSLINSI